MMHGQQNVKKTCINFFNVYCVDWQIYLVIYVKKFSSDMKQETHPNREIMGKIFQNVSF